MGKKNKKTKEKAAAAAAAPEATSLTKGDPDSKPTSLFPYSPMLHT
jgi:hypothetical protein